LVSTCSDLLRRPASYCEKSTRDIAVPPNVATDVPAGMTEIARLPNP
jgi:hypothetical protein